MSVMLLRAPVICSRPCSSPSRAPPATAAAAANGRRRCTLSSNSHLAWPAYSQQQTLRFVRAQARKREGTEVPEEGLDPDADEDILHVGDQVADAEAFAPEIDEDELEGLADEDEDEEYDEDEGDGALEDAWDQALINFPVEQDEVDLEKSPEEVKQAAALKLVRADQVSAGVEVEVEDAPDAVEGPARTYDDQLSALTVQDKEQLMTNRQGYLEFEMDGMNLLVAETAEGLLNLSDAFLYESSTDLYSRVVAGEGVPAQPALYQVIPWDLEHSGDVLKFKDPKVVNLRMYFVPVLNDGSGTEPYQVDLQQLYCFFTDSKQLQAVPIQPLSENIQDPVLRIRPEGAFIEDTSESWHWSAIAEGYGVPGVDYSHMLEELERSTDQGWAQQQPALGPGQDSEQVIEERLEELELMEELDDVPDVPAVDLV